MTQKMAISLPDATLRKAKAAGESGKAPGVSNCITGLIEAASANETFAELIADSVRESGATDEEIRAAEEEPREAFERAGLAPKEARPEEATRRKTG